MIKTLAFIAFSALCAPCFSQVVYEVERLKPDSIFLTERITNTVQGSPRKQEVTTSVLLKSETDLRKVLEGLVADGEKAAQEFAQIRARTETILNKANAAKQALQGLE